MTTTEPASLTAACLAFGAAARPWAELLPEDLSVLVVDTRDPRALEDAYIEALRRRMLAQPFFLAALVAHKETDLAQRISEAIAESSFEDRREFLDGLATDNLSINGHPSSAWVALDTEALLLARGLYHMADAVLARSPAEYEAQVKTLGYPRRPVAYYPVRPHRFDGLRSSGDGSLVVYAPELTWNRTMLFATAFEEVRMPVTIVAKTLPPKPMRARYVLASEAASVLARAVAVVDATFFDPGSALALADLGVPLAASKCTGIDLYLDNVVTYTPWKWGEIQASAYDVLAMRPPKPRRHAFDLAGVRETLASTLPVLPKERPLVSIVISTYSRPKHLERILRAFANQTYDNIECIVVNDAGEPVGDVVARFPNARLIDLPANTNDCGATPMSVGSKQARGKYVGYMADDDMCYPDHVARLVEVLERTGRGIAHGNMCIRFLERDGERDRTVGFSALGTVRFMDPQTLLCGSPVALMSTLIRRDLLDRAGHYATDLWAIADLELMLRLSLESDGAHVDHVTTEWNVDLRGGNTSLNIHDAVAEQYPVMWARYPSADRRSVVRGREKELEGIKKRKPGEFYAKPPLLFTRRDIPEFRVPASDASAMDGPSLDRNARRDSGTLS